MATVNIKVENLDEVLRDLRGTPRQISEAITIGLNRTRKGSVGQKGVIARYVSRRYTLKASKVASVTRGKVIKGLGRLEITIEDGVIGLHSFKSRTIKRGKSSSRSGGVIVQVRRGKAAKTLRSVFAFPGSKAPFFQRGRGAAKKKLFKKFGPAIASVVSENSQGIGRDITDLFEKRTTEALNAKLKGFIS